MHVARAHGLASAQHRRAARQRQIRLRAGTCRRERSAAAGRPPPDPPASVGPRIKGGVKARPPTLHSHQRAAHALRARPTHVVETPRRSVSTYRDPPPLAGLSAIRRCGDASRGVGRLSRPCARAAHWARALPLGTAVSAHGAAHCARCFALDAQGASPRRGRPCRRRRPPRHSRTTSCGARARVRARSRQRAERSRWQRGARWHAAGARGSRAATVAVRLGASSPARATTLAAVRCVRGCRSGRRAARSSRRRGAPSGAGRRTLSYALGRRGGCRRRRAAPPLVRGRAALRATPGARSPRPAPPGGRSAASRRRRRTLRAVGRSLRATARRGTAPPAADRRRG